MSMFCYQCQETTTGTGCTIRGICGKAEDVAHLQDLLVYTLKGIAVYAVQARGLNISHRATDEFLMKSLFSTITNANFSAESFEERIGDGLRLRESLRQAIVAAGGKIPGDLGDAATWTASVGEFGSKGAQVGVLSTEDQDVRSLRELLTYGVKGIAAYAEHAYALAHQDEGIFAFVEKALAAAWTTRSTRMICSHWCWKQAGSVLRSWPCWTRQIPRRTDIPSSVRSISGWATSPRSSSVVTT
jgi:hydroxylamine reductase